MSGMCSYGTVRKAQFVVVMDESTVAMLKISWAAVNADVLTVSIVILSTDFRSTRKPVHSAAAAMDGNHIFHDSVCFQWNSSSKYSHVLPVVWPKPTPTAKIA